MSALQEVEEKNENKPILCIVSESSPLAERLVQENYEKFRIIFISSSKIHPKIDIPDLYTLTYQEAQVLPKLKEQIDYSITIFENNEQRQWFPLIFEKFKFDKAKNVLLISVFIFKENYDLISTLKNDNSFIFSILGEVIVKKMDENEGEFTKFIQKGLTNSEIHFKSEANIPIYPIFINDAIKNIYRLLFGTFKRNFVYFLFYKNPETLLSAIHILGRVSPELNITIVEEESLEAKTITLKQINNIINNELLLESHFLDTDTQSFEKGLRKYISTVTKETVETIINPIVKNEKKLEKVNNFKNSFFLKSILGGITLFIFLNFFIIILSFIISKDLAVKITNGKFDQVYKDAKTSKQLLTFVKPTIYNLLEVTSQISNNQKFTNIYFTSEKILDLAIVAGQSGININNPQTLDIKKIESLISDLSYLYSEGQSISIIDNNLRLKENLDPKYSKILSLSPILKSFLGFNGEKNYLLLFQNSNELRPSGGFIGSVGEIGVDSGKFGDLKVIDVYELDGQLKIHIEPPFIVRRFLQPHLYLRDSNFQLDFEETSKKAAVIYEQESGITPNAIIAINLAVLQKIMKVIGPIEIPEYNLTVDEKNIGSAIEDTVQKNNFPGSTTKKDILSKILSQIIIRTQSDQKKAFEILKLIPELLEEKDIIFSFDDESIQKIFRANGYSATIGDFREKKNNLSNDFLYINEANIGVNKVNEFVNRQIKYDTTVTSEGLKSALQIILKNESQKDNYKSYLQIAVPKGSKIEGIKINNISQSTIPAITNPRIYEAKGFLAPKALELEQYDTKDNTIFAFIINVPSKGENQIEISYANGSSVTLSNVYDYSLHYIKQPGTLPYKLTTSVYFPENYFPNGMEIGKFKSNYVSVTNEIRKDFDFNLELIKNRD